MKKLLSLFCAIVVLSGCSMFGANGGLFGGSECDSREARDFMANAKDRVFFAFDSSSISDNAVEVLQTQVKWLKKHEKVNVIVQGYCDDRGTREYNLALGERRANAVKNYLVAGGIPADRVTSVGNGESEAKMTKECQAKFKKRADLIACLAPDRRVDVEISAMREEAAK